MYVTFVSTVSEECFDVVYKKATDYAHCFLDVDFGHDHLDRKTDYEPAKNDTLEQVKLPLQARRIINLSFSILQNQLKMLLWYKLKLPFQARRIINLSFSMLQNQLKMIPWYKLKLPFQARLFLCLQLHLRLQEIQEIQKN